MQSCSWVALYRSQQPDLCCKPHARPEAIARKAALAHGDRDALPVAIQPRLQHNNSALTSSSAMRMWASRLMSLGPAVK
jgi:hypothetical protein